MKVSELMEKLNKINGNDDVYVEIETEEGELVSFEIDGIEQDGENTFITTKQ